MRLPLASDGKSSSESKRRQRRRTFKRLHNCSASAAALDTAPPALSLSLFPLSCSKTYDGGSIGGGGIGAALLLPPHRCSKTHSTFSVCKQQKRPSVALSSRQNLRDSLSLFLVTPMPMQDEDDATLSTNGAACRNVALGCNCRARCCVFVSAARRRRVAFRRSHGLLRAPFIGKLAHYYFYFHAHFHARHRNCSKTVRCLRPAPPPVCVCYVCDVCVCLICTGKIDNKLGN